MQARDRRYRPTHHEMETVIHRALLAETTIRVTYIRTPVVSAHRPRACQTAHNPVTVVVLLSSFLTMRKVSPALHQCFSSDPWHKDPSQCRCTEPDTPSCPPGQTSTTATESPTSAYTSQSTDSSASALSTNASSSITSTPSLSSTSSYTLSSNSVGPSSASSNDTSQPARAAGAHPLNVRAIVGGTIGGMMILMLLLGLLLYRQRKAHRAPPSAEVSAACVPVVACADTVIFQFLEMGIRRTTPALSVDAKVPPREDGRPSSRADGLPGYGHGGSFSVDEKSPMVPVEAGYGVAE
jgi:hypothetical protein